jgi:uncharacterized membrane protein
LIGTFVAGLLYYAHRNNIQLPCTTGNGCDLVAASHWAYLYGIPVALLGTAAYVALALMTVLKHYSEKDSVSSAFRYLMLLVSLGGASFSWYLQYVADVYIGAFCIYCRTSAITITLICLVTVAEQIAMHRARRVANGTPAGAGLA